MAKKKVWLIEQGVWQAVPGRRPPMPLASGYLKAAAEADERLRDELDIRIFSFPGGGRIVGMIRELFFDATPDLIAFSVFGWNYHTFGRIAELYRRLNPRGWIVWGGTHVAGQAGRTFSMFPEVDVVVNGEGEWVFRDLLRAWLGDTSRHDLGGIRGISYRDPDGKTATTPDAGRIQDLELIPSPILSGALQLTDDRGNYRYDLALLETNRGCPYTCSFCYWGGAIGQKIRTFSLDRLTEEVERLARAGVEEIMLCDANFGILPQDEEFVEVCIRARERHGYPRRIMTSWAKNKRKPFYRIVKRLKETGFHSSFNLALQSVSEPTLDEMHRRNMQINDWKDLADWLRAEGMPAYAELIWGCPGETCESFLDGYDRLSRHVTSIAIYPLLLLPNTSYVERKEELGLVTWRGDHDDFERVLQHKTMSIADNRRMHRFLFWARILAEHILLRHIWRPLDRLASVTQSAVLLALDEWLDAQDDPGAADLRRRRDLAVDEFDVGAESIERGLMFFYSYHDIDAFMDRWWREAILPRVGADLRDFFLDVFRYDWLSRPIYAPQGPAGLPVVERDGERLYVRKGVRFEHDVAALLKELEEAGEVQVVPKPTLIDFYYRPGFCNDMSLYHNAQNEHFFGIPEPWREDDVPGLVLQRSM